MPTIALSGQDQEQWTHGSPAALSNMLLNGFMFLQESTTVKNKAKHMVEGVDATTAYSKVFTNITNMFSPMGNAKLRSGTLKDKSNQFLDYSALLGAYFRSSINGKDGDPIVGLSADQLVAVYNFVQPLVPPNTTAKAYLDGLAGTPSAKHKAVLKELLFLGVTPDERANMVKSKYREKADDFIDSMLSVVDFMRTPFSVLDAQEAAEVAAAKKSGVAVKTSGVDLQWSSMQKGVTGGGWRQF